MNATTCADCDWTLDEPGALWCPLCRIARGIVPVLEAAPSLDGIGVCGRCRAYDTMPGEAMCENCHSLTAAEKELAVIERKRRWDANRAPQRRAPRVVAEVNDTVDFFTWLLSVMVPLALLAGAAWAWPVPTACVVALALFRYLQMRWQRFVEGGVLR